MRWRACFLTRQVLISIRLQTAVPTRRQACLGDGELSLTQMNRMRDKLSWFFFFWHLKQEYLLAIAMKFELHFFQEDSMLNWGPESHLGAFLEMELFLKFIFCTNSSHIWASLLSGFFYSRKSFLKTIHRSRYCRPHYIYSAFSSLSDSSCPLKLQ